MSYINTPDFPVVSWNVVFDSPVTITLRGNFGGGAVSTTITFPAGNYKGFDVDSLARSESDSMWGTLESLIEAALQDPAKFNQATGICTITRQWLTSVTGLSSEVANYLSANILIFGTSPATADFEIEFPNDSIAERFGVNTTANGGTNTITIPQAASPFQQTNDYNSAGYWAPYQLTVVESRNFQSTVFSNQRLSGGSVDVVRWGDDREISTMTFPYVYAAYVWSYRAVRPEFSAPAERFSYDPNNLLETLKEVATQTGQQDFLLFQDDGDKAVITIPNSEALSNFDALITEDVSGNGQLLQVTLSHNIISKSGGFI